MFVLVRCRFTDSFDRRGALVVLMMLVVVVDVVVVVEVVISHRSSIYCTNLFKIRSIFCSIINLQSKYNIIVIRVRERSIAKY